MNRAVFRDTDEPARSGQTPFLSHSRLSRYLHCPEQYRLYYVENLRPRIPAASLIFGQAIHQALATLFRSLGDSVKHFQEIWHGISDLELDYSVKESWDKLKTTGEILLARFVAEELPRLRNIGAVEKVFELGITNLDLPFVGVIDLVADLDGKKTVVDFKTSALPYQEHEVILSDQLTAYMLAQPEADQVALCVMVKAKVPKIEWHLTHRTPEQLTDYLAKAGLVALEITAGHFYKRPGKWCAWCDYLPVCAGKTDEAAKALVRIDDPGGHEDLEPRRKETSHASA